VAGSLEVARYAGLNPGCYLLLEEEEQVTPGFWSPRSEVLFRPGVAESGRLDQGEDHKLAFNVANCMMRMVVE
jgi:hypothetical protein